MPWWERFYDDLGGDVDRVTAIRPDATEEEVAFALRVLDLRPPARILDLGCGTGRHSLAFAQRGFTVVGIDRSPAQLAAAEAKRAASGLAARWVRADLRALPDLPPADAAVCLFNTWGYFLDDEDNRAVLRSARSRLHPGAGLLLDCLNADALMRRTGRATRFVGGGAGVNEELAYDADRRLLHARWRVHLDGRVRGTYVIHQRLYRAVEVRQRLADAGFRPESVYADTRGGRLQPWSPRAIWVARAVAPAARRRPGRRVAGGLGPDRLEGMKR